MIMALAVILGILAGSACTALGFYIGRAVYYSPPRIVSPSNPSKPSMQQRIARDLAAIIEAPDATTARIVSPTKRAASSLVDLEEKTI